MNNDNDIDFLNHFITFGGDGEYDVHYTSRKRVVKIRELENSQGGEEKQMELKATNKRKRENLTFGIVPEFGYLEHTKELLTEPILNVPDRVDTQKPNSIFSLFFTGHPLENTVRNTSLYATTETSKNKERPWKDTDIKELKTWIALVIYQGVYKSPELSDYWNTDPRFPTHTNTQCMSLVRFQQIKRYLHVAPDSKKPKHYYDKVNPLMDHVQTVSQELYTPKSNVSLDEMIVQFKGRSKDTYRIKMKPIPQGYKIISLCDSGYTFAFYPTSIAVKSDSFVWTVNSCLVSMTRTRKKNQYVIPKVGGLTQTGDLVSYLVTQLDYKKYAYNVYMDNYFTSIALFEQFCDMGIGACGTVKRSIVLSPAQLKEAKKVEWNTRAGFIKGGVLALFWKDNGPVTMLTTIYELEGDDWEVLKNRRRPRLTSTNGRHIAGQYGDNYKMQFPIPRAVDDYNNNMNGVDQADQLRSYYATRKTSQRTWLPLFFWLLDASYVDGSAKRV